MQGRQLVVEDAPHFPAHNLSKNTVDAGKHLGSASEILMQVDLHSSLRLRPAPVSLILFQKQFRSGQTELIDTLLHIPHHEAVISALSLTGDAG